MEFENAAIPLGLAWSSPFVRWQGALAEVCSLDLAVDVTGRALADRGLRPDAFDRLVLGWTVPQPGMFYGAPTVAARLGAERLSGPMLSQACATSAVCVESAAVLAEQEGGLNLVVATDRVSNGPVLSYPRPSAPGGAPALENWVLDNFACDPWAGEAMVATAEAVAREADLSREEIDEVTLLRYEQYASALADGRAFQRRWMVPAAVPAGRRETRLVEEDQGVHQTSREALAGLRPVQPEGVVSYGTQTHPADGCAGCVVTPAERARELADGNGVARILGTGLARVDKARMPRAPVPAAERALRSAGLGIGDVDLVTTHNPFAVNDLWFTRQTGYPLERMNVYGCSLVYGHPQAPTGLRLLVELLEALRERGGGVGLFTGCAAGDTGAAVVVRVE
ncbi:MAG: thiolase family protein [Candidatus Dormibacteraeota bacterium]|nr:thiolase family protein [Candidatus Dormibacteraeota bacterium]MBO0761137.1 thiolase family protein [Candidatus Dormibacteraeota bacterium]